VSKENVLFFFCFGRRPKLCGWNENWPEQSREKGNHFIYFQCKERCFGSMPVNFFRVKNPVRVDSPRMNKMPFIRMFTYPISMRLGFDLGSIRICSWSYDSRNLR
jgi:hypothetical protein